MSEGPFTDEMIRHYLMTVKTQRGIIEYAEAMANVLAEAGRASEKALGDSAMVAVNKWSEIIRKRAVELIEEGNPESRQQKSRQKLRKRFPYSKLLEHDD